MLLRDAVSENDVAVTSEMIAATQMLMIYE